MSSDIAALTHGLSKKQLAAMSGQNHDAQYYTVASVFSVLTILAVILRSSSRHMKKVAFGIDDALLVAALVIALAQTIWICIGVRDYGLGRHIWTLNKHQFINFEKLFYASGFLQCTGELLAKYSLIILFHRIFVTTGFRIALKVVAAINTAWWLGTILTHALICIPPSKNWNPTEKGHCGNKHLVAIIVPIFWILTDVILLLMPIAMVWKLHLPRLQRVGLAALFLLGGFSTFASCYRYSQLFFSFKDITYVYITLERSRSQSRSFNQVKPPSVNPEKFFCTDDATPAVLWTIIELDMTIITVCLIVSRPWFMNIYPSKLISVVHSKLSSFLQSITSSSSSSSPSPSGSPSNSSPNKNSNGNGNGNSGGKNSKTKSKSKPRWPVLSSFRRLDDRPPAVTNVSMGAPFEFDVEKKAGRVEHEEGIVQTERERIAKD